MTIQELIEKDHTFSESGFIAKVDNTFIMLLTSIMTDNIDRVKHKLSDDLFEKYKTLVNSLNERNERQMYDELNVKSTNIQTIEEDGDYYIIKVLLISRYMDYKMDKTTLKLISGNNNSRIEKTNYLTFKKLKTARDESIARKCPTCGASADTNNTGICPFCHSSYNTYKYDWVLTNLDH